MDYLPKMAVKKESLLKNYQNSYTFAYVYIYVKTVYLTEFSLFKAILNTA